MLHFSNLIFIKLLPEANNPVDTYKKIVYYVLNHNIENSMIKRVVHIEMESELGVVRA